jgi:hypothetical protein
MDETWFSGVESTNRERARLARETLRVLQASEVDEAVSRAIPEVSDDWNEQFKEFLGRARSETILVGKAGPEAAFAYAPKSQDGIWVSWGSTRASGKISAKNLGLLEEMARERGVG